MRIKTKLTILFLSVALIPMLFIGHIVFDNSQKSLERQIFRLLEVSADFKARAISDYFEERKSDLSVLLNRNVVKNYLPVLDRLKGTPSDPAYVEAREQVHSQMAIVRKAYGLIDVMLMNAKGETVYASSPGEDVDQDKEDVLKYAPAGFHVGKIHSCESRKGVYVFDVSGPVLGQDGAIAGFVHFEVSMEPFYEILNRSSAFEKTLEALLVTKTGDNKVLFISPVREDPKAIMTKTVELGSANALPAQKAALGESGFGISIDYSGHKVLSVWRPIPELGWGLVAKVDVEEAFAPVRKLLKTVLMLLFMVVLILIVVVLAVARSISDPIHKLQKGAEIIGHGQWDHELKINSKDEIGDLARSFRDMAKNLKFLVQKEKEFILADARIEAEKEKANELRSLNQQLLANEQQLKAANQQLTASDQQQKAMNQQLRANEQQLKAANQQLSALEQELRAAKTGLEEKVKERTRELEEMRDSLVEIVESRTRELQEKMESMEKMNKFMVDREMRVIELKKEVNKLCKELGKPEPYSGGIS